ncbi:MAG: PQQ-binding-like beta-propeller repeat protein [Treponema sp.]|jgi:outer membrane protein assembly factor BamB|nr:PQQ-binding-like beta-propeller repeat protein [Treponema sp.]
MRYHKYLLSFIMFTLSVASLTPQSAGRNIALPTARPVWQLALGAQALGLPAVQDGAVVVVCNGGSVRAYTEDGKPLWTYTTPGRLTPYLSRTQEGMSYICRTNGNLIALNRVGRELWRVNLGAPLVAPVLLGWDGRIFAATARKLFCYTQAGYPLWSKPLQSAIAVTPVSDKQGGFVMALANGELLRVSVFGQLISCELSDEAAVLVPLSGNGEEAPVLILYKSGAMEINGNAAYPPLPTLPAPPKAAIDRQNTGDPTDKVAITLVNGQVVLLSLIEGRILWTGQSNIQPEELAKDDTDLIMRYSEQGIYTLAKSGAAGFSEEGERRWFFRLVGASSLSAWSDNGLLFSGGTDWVFYAYRFEDAPLTPEVAPDTPVQRSYNLGEFPPRGDYRFSDSELKLRFSRINEAISKGQIGEDEKAFTRYLMEVAASLRNSPQPSTNRPPVQMNHRAEAARLLGSIGSVELVPFLIDLFNNDPEPLVKAAAAESIGRVGIDPGGLAMDAFSSVILGLHAIRDTQALIAIAGAIGSLCRFSGPILSATGAKLLVTLLASTNPSAVRNRARWELDQLR